MIYSGSDVPGLETIQWDREVTFPPEYQSPPPPPPSTVFIFTWSYLSSPESSRLTVPRSGIERQLSYRHARLQRLEPDQVYAAYCRILKELLRVMLSLTKG
jgi:hypothetical protein